MSYLQTAGPAADPVTHLHWGMLAISLAVVVIISILVLWATFYRRPPAQSRPDGRPPLETARDGLSWITIGVGISTAVLLGAAAWTMITLSTVAAPAAGGALHINVIAHQWWWEASYPGNRQSEPVIVANEIHIPVGQPVLLELASDDVIHSFWIPKLAGKTDMVPGQTNHAWLQANQAGDYRGQCGEYCGAQHAQMALHVIAEPPDAFAAWLRRQRQPSAAPADMQALHGQQIFLARCGMCHTVNGSDAHGRTGPDLTHLVARHTIAAGVLPNTPGERARWVANPQDLKPGVRMPVVELNREDRQALMAYLETLK
ncbi:cytochrome c oxidase subunit II [Massilia horti]|nr:cytochrome c oxidase subunit II [Massilia horti]